MSIAPRPSAKRNRRSKPFTSQNLSRRGSKNRATSNRLKFRIAERKVQKLSTSSQQMPVWLRSLSFLYKGSSVIAFCLITINLAVYAWTVYIQQLWSQEYQKLENLQRDERNLVATNETLKNKLAKKAENPEIGLVAPNSKNTIFLKSAPEPHLNSPKPTNINENVSEAANPLGY